MVEELKSEDVIHRGCGGEVKIKHIPSQLFDYIYWRCQKCKAEARSSSYVDYSDINESKESPELSEDAKSIIKALAEVIISEEKERVKKITYE